MSVVPSLLATGMTRSDDCARSSVPCRSGSDCGTGCGTLSIGVLVLLLLVLRLLGLRRPSICRLWLR